MTALIELRQVLVRRAERPVLEAEHLVIEQGQITALVGPNGAGKSTLLLVLARLLELERGEFLFHGRPLEQLPELEYRRRVGLVMQEALLLSRSVFDNAAIGLRYRGLPKNEVVHRTDLWLERLGILSLRQRPATQLSGGEARRLVLARALVVEPELLLLDEPFGALDRAARSLLLDDLKALLALTHTTTVFATHSESEVRKLADREIELDGGRLKRYD